MGSHKSASKRGKHAGKPKPGNPGYTVRPPGCLDFTLIVVLAAVAAVVALF